MFHICHEEVSLALSLMSEFKIIVASLRAYAAMKFGKKPCSCGHNHEVKQ